MSVLINSFPSLLTESPLFAAPVLLTQCTINVFQNDITRNNLHAKETQNFNQKNNQDALEGNVT